jgi:hypothetical protein
MLKLWSRAGWHRAVFWIGIDDQLVRDQSEMGWRGQE